MDSNHPATLAAVDPNVGYYPHGAIRIMTLGNGLKATTAYDSRLQPCRINLNSSGTYLGACADSVPGGNVQDFSYGFGASNNGNVTSWSATGTQTFSRSYTYDSLNRLGTYSSPSDASGCTGLSWTYDRWGNRTGQNVTGGTCGAPQFTFTNNKITNPGFQYDAAGNLTNDGSHSYSYDAENRLTAVDGGSTASFVYDAAGLRLLKTVGSATTTYVRDMDGNIVAEMNGSTWGRGSIFWDGRLLAQYWGGTTQFVLPDRLNSTRLLTSMNQSIYDSMDFLPYGELLSGGSSTYFKFTGYERDGESGKDYAFARYFRSNMGRFMSPDPLAGDASDPQSLNLYTYVRNNPANLVDPSGLCAESFWGGSCNDFGISITWSWGSGRDDAPRPLHPHPTRPPSRTGPSPHVAYSFLPGETAGVPNWVTGRSDLSRWVIVNFASGHRTWKNYADFLDWMLFISGPYHSLSPGLELVRQQVRAYENCVSSAAASHDKRLQDIAGIAQQTDDMHGVNQDPFGGHASPDRGSSPELPPGVGAAGSWSLVVGTLWTERKYHQEVGACATGHPIADLAPRMP